MLSLNCRFILLIFIYISIINTIAFNNALANAALTEANKSVQDAQDAMNTRYNEYQQTLRDLENSWRRRAALQALVASTSGAEKEQAQAQLKAENKLVLPLRASRDAAEAVYLQAREVHSGLQTQLTVASKDTIGISLCNITSVLSGGIAKTIATIAVISVGFAMFMGKASWTTALLSSAGIAITFGTQKIIQLITGGSGASNACIFSG